MLPISEQRKTINKAIFTENPEANKISDSTLAQYLAPEYTNPNPHYT
jgi:hypothetical protein